jgi:multiple sugar transport system ATP-binding protein
MTMGDRVAVLKRGVLQQVDTPQVLYDSPVNLFVGGFIGSPAMNLLEAALDADGETCWVTFGSQRLRLPPDVLHARPALRDRIGSTLVLGIRPENFADPATVDRPPDDDRVQVQVDLVERLGSEVYAHFSMEARPVRTEDTRELLREGADLSESALERRVTAETTTGVARLDPGTQVSEGVRAELVVDTRRLYFFDLEHGLAIGDVRARDGPVAVASSAHDQREDDGSAHDE